MKLMLDSSVVISYLRGNPATLTRLLRLNKRDVGISSIVLCEILATRHLGDRRAADLDQAELVAKRFTVLAFDSRAAQSAAALFARHDIQGDRVPVFDGLIAAHAHSLKVTIAYIDGDFNRFAVKKQLWAGPAT